MKWLLSVDRREPAAVRRYCAWVERLQIVPVPVSKADRIDRWMAFDALLLTGGGDMHPDFYGRPRTDKTRYVDPQRDRFELNLVAECIRLRKPVFGICRGIQVINVAFRGALIQDLPDWFLARNAAPEEHRRMHNEDSLHTIQWSTDTDFGKVFQEVREVNSAHHQAVDPDAIGNGLVVVAQSPAGVIESVVATGIGSPVIGVQWHPERLPFEHPASAQLLRYWQQTAASVEV